MVCRRVDPSTFYRAFQVNYPTEVDALSGLLDGLVNRGEYDLIMCACAQGLTPPASTLAGWAGGHDRSLAIP